MSEDEKVPEREVRWGVGFHPAPPGWVFLAEILVSAAMPGNVRLSINGSFPFDCLHPGAIEQLLGMLRCELEAVRDVHVKRAAASGN